MSAESASVLAPALPEIPGGWTEREFALGGRHLLLTLPGDPDAFLDDPAVLAANRRDDYMPYWSYLWPASLETAVAIGAQPWPLDVPILEIGAGVALAGLAALASGYRVTISDYDPQALLLAEHNARRNGSTDRLETLLLDWRSPLERRFPVIVGCEVIYERKNHPLVLRVLQAMLAPGGEAWITDPGRHQVQAFLDDVARSPFAVEHRALPARAVSWPSRRSDASVHSALEVVAAGGLPWRQHCPVYPPHDCGSDNLRAAMFRRFISCSRIRA